MCGAMPTPSSITSSTTRGFGPSSSRVAITMRPPLSGIASRAFTTRFMSTCSSWEKSPTTSPVAASELGDDLDATIERVGRMSDATATATSWSETRLAKCFPRRAKPSSARVSCAALSVTSSIFFEVAELHGVVFVSAKHRGHHFSRRREDC